MAEIKLMGYHPKYKLWTRRPATQHNNFDFTFVHPTTALGKIDNMDDFFIVQWIGIQDSKGKDVYVDHIVMTTQFEGLAVVTFVDFLAQFALERRVYRSNDPDDFTFESEPIDPDATLTILGNIHENEGIMQWPK